MRYPAAVWKPLASNFNKQPKMAKYDLVILHTMVGSLSGTDAYFRTDGYGGAESHFGIGHDGVVYQWQDTAFQAEANGAANKRAISIETADTGTGFAKWNTSDGAAVPAWTPAQVEAIITLTKWICDNHKIPKQSVLDSKPDRRGIAYHRLGVPGYAVSGGELWSSARGKVCPGPRRIAQIPAIISRVKGEEDIVASLDDLKKVLADGLATVAKRADVGFARDQILTQMGVDDTAAAPADKPKDQLLALATKRDVAALEMKVDELLIAIAGLLSVADDPTP